MQPNRRLYQLIVLAILASVSMVTKSYVKAILDPICQAIGVPTGVMAGVVYMAWVALAGEAYGDRGGFLLFSAFQGVLAIVLGMSGSLGLAGVFSYLISGIVFEGFRMLYPASAKYYLVAGAGLGNSVSSVFNAWLFFRLQGRVISVLLIPSLVTGALGGYFGYYLALRMASMSDAKHKGRQMVR